MTYTVIGGGLAGLAASIELARMGKPVRLMEQHRELGGRADTTEHQGFSLNLGPHAVYLGGTMYRTLSKWGVMPSGGRPVLADGAFMVMGGRKHGFVRDLPSLATCGFLSIGERVEAGRVWAKMSGAPDCTMKAWLDHEVSSPSVRHFFEGLTRLSTYCGGLDKLSASAALAQMALGQGGVTYVDHGWRTMIRNLADYARSLGVEIVTGQPGSRPEGPTVLAVSPSEVEKLMARSAGAVTPIKMATLDIALERMPEGSAKFGLGLDQPLYYSAHSTWVKVAPPGKAVVHVAKYAASADRGELEAFADLLMPGWRELVVHARFLPDMTVTHAIPGVDGRQDVDALGVDGVRIAGDWVGPEGMLADAAVASGLRAARSLLA
ncbi:MAG: NAD(P)-binding protein [Bryobacteraceae bacterium]